MSEIIAVRDLKVRFVVRKKGKGMFSPRQKVLVDALAGVSFSIGQGEFVGYIGPNGAGKSTTIKCLSGILTPTDGDIRVLGRVPWKERVKHVGEIGVVFGQRTQLWWDLPVEDSFELLRDIYRVDPVDFAQTKRKLVEAMDIGNLLRTPVRQLSLGQRMRCDLAAALLHRPRLLFLDEPTIGLDAVSKLNMRAFVKELNQKQGTTVLLTTHDMADVETLCQRLMLIGRGRLLMDGTVDSLRDLAGGKRVLKASVGPGALILPEGAQLRARNGEEIEVLFDPRVLPADQLVLHLAGSVGLKDMQVQAMPLEETVAALYRNMAEVSA